METLLCLVGVLWLAIGFQRDFRPDKLLYRRWQLVQTRQGTTDWLADTSTVPNTIDYQRNGTLVYRQDGQTTGLCGRANRFCLQQTEITSFVDITCEYVLRTEPLNYKLTITQLTGNLLELSSGQTISKYKPVQ